MSRRRRTRPRGEPDPRGQAAGLRNTGRRVRAYLRRNRVDLAPLGEVASALDVTEVMVRATAARYDDLGIGGDAGAEHVWWAPPAALDAGFQPVAVDGQLALRLAARHPGGAPLHISGRHLGPAPDAELDLPELEQVGVGPLGYTIARLMLMAGHRSTTSTRSDRSALFELIAHAWHTSPGPVWSSYRLDIHLGRDGGPAGIRLELVVWADERGALQLVNCYPVSPHNLEVPNA